MLTHLLSFLAGALVVYVWMTLRRPAQAWSPSAQNPDIHGQRTPLPGPTDEQLEERIIEYLTTNVVYHINDLCQSLEHPKGARYVRGQFHKLMEQGKIRYKDMVYTI